MVREKITNLIEKAIQNAQSQRKLPKFQISAILVEKPEQKEQGDYSTNIAMKIAGITKKNPIETAEIIVEQLQNSNSQFLGKIEIARPGFINFFLSKIYLQKQIKQVLEQGEKFGDLKIGKNKKTQVEFISGNPTGPLHIGQGRGAFFGDCLSNVLAKAGYKVEREYYVNNAKNSNQIKELGKTGMSRGTAYLTDELKAIIKEQKHKIENMKSESQAGYFLCKIIQKENKDFILKKLKIKITNWVFEQDLYKENKIEKAYNLLKKKNLIYESECAQWLKTKKFGDSKDWVVKRSTGEPTYFLADIAYHKDKFDRGFKKIIDIWGADHQGHIGKMKAASKMLEYKGELNILIAQVVRLKGGLKLSKRKGQIVGLEELVDEVGLDAARFFYLAKSLNTQMEFDLELAKEQSQKNPVYYVQYAHARIQSILNKVKTQNTKHKSSRPHRYAKHCGQAKFELLEHTSELNLIKQVIRFPEVVGDTAEDYRVQRLPQYALDLAEAFHQFYRDCPVISDNKELTQARTALILAVQFVLKNSLGLMGISAPSKM
ncbi:arginine--tRNA ligase [Candidatus Parcubacteria bacterium]|nr:arginine--tRNA ligase [Candidatus Parcubacteria bacterium]